MSLDSRIYQECEESPPNMNLVLGHAQVDFMAWSDPGVVYEALQGLARSMDMDTWTVTPEWLSFFVSAEPRMLLRRERKEWRENVEMILVEFHATVRWHAIRYGDCYDGGYEGIMEALERCIKKVRGASALMNEPQRRRRRRRRV